MVMRTVLVSGLALAGLAACSSVSVGIGLPIGRFGGISIGGTVPVAPAEGAAKPASAAASGSAAASAPAAPAAASAPARITP
jgi:hypothetical protein